MRAENDAVGRKARTAFAASLPNVAERMLLRFVVAQTKNAAVHTAAKLRALVVVDRVARRIVSAATEYVALRASRV